MLKKSEKIPAFTKMQQVYWEAKQAFNKSLGQREDSCIISSDSQLDQKLELLQAAANYFDSLMKIILDYRAASKRLIKAEGNLGHALIGYGIKDSTYAGKVLIISGKSICKVGQRLSSLQTSLLSLYHEIDTFQFKATADTLRTVTAMEKVRRSYRSGLMWMKNESADLDPDVIKKMRNFRKVQDHIKRLKIKFDGIKLETMQKIDLLLLSRSNLFSYTLLPYTKTLKRSFKNSASALDMCLKSIPSQLFYKFETLKELNQYSKTMNLADKKCSLKNSETGSKEDSSASKKVVSNKRAKCVRFKINPDSKPRGMENEKQINEALLIDLTESGGTKSKDLSDSLSNYVNDLSLISFDESKSKKDTRSNISLLELQTIFDQKESNISQESSSETSGLAFWSLMKNMGNSENPSKHHEAKSPNTLLTAEPSNTRSFSKWNDILAEFDPFVDESLLSEKNKNYFEAC